MKTLCHAVLAAALLIASTPAIANSIPASSGTTLDGRKMTLPADLRSPATILILGFSKDSQAATTTWEKAVRTSLADTPAIGYLDIPFLEDAPSFIRPVILRSIRRQVPDIVKPNFLPLTNGQAAWKQAAAFTSSAPDAAYVLLVDRSGIIQWQTHDPYSPALLAQLAREAKKLAKQAA
jgi:hypothetical protein